VKSAGEDVTSAELWWTPGSSGGFGLDVRADDLGGNAGDDRVGRDIIDNEGVGPHDGPGADRHRAENRRAHADEAAVLEDRDLVPARASSDDDMRADDHVPSDAATWVKDDSQSSVGHGGPFADLGGHRDAAVEDDVNEVVEKAGHERNPMLMAPVAETVEGDRAHRPLPILNHRVRPSRWRKTIPGESASSPTALRSAARAPKRPEWDPGRREGRRRGGSLLRQSQGRSVRAETERAAGAKCSEAAPHRSARRNNPDAALLEGGMLALARNP